MKRIWQLFNLVLYYRLFCEPGSRPTFPFEDVSITVDVLPTVVNHNSFKSNDLTLGSGP